MGPNKFQINQDDRVDKHDQGHWKYPKLEHPVKVTLCVVLWGTPSVHWRILST